MSNTTEESNLVAHARRELELAGMLNAEPDEEITEVFNDYNNMVGEAVMELVRVFSSQGHSGFSAGVVVDLFSHVAKYQTLTENDHSLYQDVSEYSFSKEDIAAGKTMWQCSRDSKWFSDDKGATWYNVDDKVTRQ